MDKVIVEFIVSVNLLTKIVTSEGKIDLVDEKFDEHTKKRIDNLRKMYENTYKFLEDMVLFQYHNIAQRIFSHCITPDFENVFSETVKHKIVNNPTERFKIKIDSIDSRIETYATVNTLSILLAEDSSLERDGSATIQLHIPIEIYNDYLTGENKFGEDHIFTETVKTVSNIIDNRLRYAKHVQAIVRNDKTVALFTVYDVPV